MLRVIFSGLEDRPAVFTLSVFCNRSEAVLAEAAGDRQIYLRTERIEGRMIIWLLVELNGLAIVRPRKTSRLSTL